MHVSLALLDTHSKTLVHKDFFSFFAYSAIWILAFHIQNYSDGLIGKHVLTGRERERLACLLVLAERIVASVDKETAYCSSACLSLVYSFFLPETNFDVLSVVIWLFFCMIFTFMPKWQILSWLLWGVEVWVCHI